MLNIICKNNNGNSNVQYVSNNINAIHYTNTYFIFKRIPY